jgi:aminopeptidase-like protein
MARSIGAVRAGLDREAVGRAMHQGVSDLYPICRSITGEGLRQTLRYVGERVPLTVREVPSGTEVFDCNDEYVAKGLKTAAVTAAKLNSDRIATQFGTFTPK